MKDEIVIAEALGGQVIGQFIFRICVHFRQLQLPNRCSRFGQGLEVEHDYFFAIFANSHCNSIYRSFCYKVTILISSRSSLRYIFSIFCFRIEGVTENWNRGITATA